MWQQAAEAGGRVAAGRGEKRRMEEPAARARARGNQERVWWRMSGPFPGWRQFARPASAAAAGAGAPRAGRHGEAAGQSGSGG